MLHGTHPCPDAPHLPPQLATGSEFAANHEQNNHYLLLLDPDNLLWCFRWGLLMRGARPAVGACGHGTKPRLRAMQRLTVACKGRRLTCIAPFRRCRDNAGLDAPGEAYGGW